MPDPSCAATPRTTSAIDGSTSTSRVPSSVLTFGRISGCASMPRASPITGMIVVRVIPLVATDACVSCLSRGFQPLLELSAERVSQGSVVVCAAEGVSTAPRTSAAIGGKKWRSFIRSPPTRARCSKGPGRTQDEPFGDTRLVHPAPVKVNPRGAPRFELSHGQGKLFSAGFRAWGSNSKLSDRQGGPQAAWAKAVCTSCS